MSEKILPDVVELLKQLIATPSFSREEEQTATIIENFFSGRNIVSNRYLNNIWCINKYFDKNKPTVLLNSHHDTVKPNALYSKDPFNPLVEDGKLFGLGSNDAGGALVCLIAAFVHFYGRQDMKFNIIIAATAEEEISGKNGIECILPMLPAIDCAIVGEPTLTNLAVAEKGLLVLDCITKGKAGHAAREEGESALYKAMDDINWIRNYMFPSISETLGPVKMSVTVIGTENKAHNVVPDQCSYVVDIRVTDVYTHEEIMETIRQHVNATITPRSTRLRASSIDVSHPLVKAGLAMGRQTYGSPTTSDQALIPAPSLKCGPGDSARSHTADEYIYLYEIEQGIETYLALLNAIV